MPHGNATSHLLFGSSLAAQTAKDLAVSLQWLGNGIHPWPGNFCTLCVWPKKTQKKAVLFGERETVFALKVLEFLII